MFKKSILFLLFAGLIASTVNAQNNDFVYEYRSRVPSENYKKHDIHTEVTFRLKI